MSKLIEHVETPKGFDWFSRNPNNISINQNAEVLHLVKGDSALCGFRPKHGWAIDLYSWERCERCLKRLENGIT